MPFFDQLDVYEDSTPRSAALNMAVDEALLEDAAQPLIRIYGWDHPALSFGYFGKFKNVAEHELDRDLVRRWTGGGIVFHGTDLTYSLIIPASPQDRRVSSQSVYSVVHTALRDALLQRGCETKLATAPAALASESCFERPVVADVLWQGRKVAGAAHRWTRAGLLHQGSIQDVDVSNGLGRAFAGFLARTCHEKELSSGLVQRAMDMAEAKYATDAWLHRR